MIATGAWRRAFASGAFFLDHPLRFFLGILATLDDKPRAEAPIHTTAAIAQYANSTRLVLPHLIRFATDYVKFEPLQKASALKLHPGPAYRALPFRAQIQLQPDYSAHRVCGLICSNSQIHTLRFFSFFPYSLQLLWLLWAK